MGKGIKIRVPHDRLCELGQMYRALIMSYEAVNEHMELLYAHIGLMHQRLKVMAVKEQEKYMVNLTDAEALAFRQLWCSPDIDVPGATEWGATITRSMVAVIDQQLTNKRVICKR